MILACWNDWFFSFFSSLLCFQLINILRWKNLIVHSWKWKGSSNLSFFFFVNQIRLALGLDRCRLCVVGAAPVTLETIRYFQSINIPLFELYGMSESTGPATISIPGYVKAGSCGVAFDGVEVKIHNKDQEGNGEVSLNTIGWTVLSKRHQRSHTPFTN